MLFQAQYNVTSTCLITLHVAVAFYNQFFFQVIKCTLIITTTYCFLFIAGREYKIGKALKSKKKKGLTMQSGFMPFSHFSVIVFITLCKPFNNMSRFCGCINLYTSCKDHTNKF